VANPTNDLLLPAMTDCRRSLMIEARHLPVNVNECAAASMPLTTRERTHVVAQWRRLEAV
jgi:hypothetical protein